VGQIGQVIQAATLERKQTSGRRWPMGATWNSRACRCPMAMAC
jgi:hypothetical protein